MLKELAAFRRFCNTIWEYDAWTNEIYMHHNLRMPQSCDQWHPYDECYRLHRDRYVFGEDRAVWEQYMSPESLQHFLQSGKEEEHFLVRTKHEEQEMEWHEAYLSRVSENRLMVVSRDIKKLQRNETITQAADAEMDYVCRIDVVTGKYVFFYSENEKGMVPGHELKDFHESIAAFIRETVISEEVEELSRNMRIENVVKQLENKDEYLLYATEKNGEDFRYKKFRFNYADESKRELLLTRIDISDLVRERKQKEHEEKFLLNALQKNRDEMMHVLKTTTTLVFRYFPEQNRISFKELDEEFEGSALPAEDVIGKLIVKGYLAGAYETRVREALTKMQNGEDQVSVTIQARQSIDFPWSWFKVVLFAYQDEKTKERKVLGYLQNIDHVILEQEQLRRMAQLDPLTGILNVGAGKKQVRDILEKQAEAAGEYNVMFMMDIDDFKQVNDTHGHIVGDETLKCFARVLKKTFRAEDVVYRLGGDEFAAFVEGILEYETAIRSIMERLIGQLEFVREKYPFLSISVGIFVSNTTRDYQRYYQEADRALYETKRNGKNHYTIRTATKENAYFRSSHTAYRFEAEGEPELNN